MKSCTHALESPSFASLVAAGALTLLAAAPTLGQCFTVNLQDESDPTWNTQVNALAVLPGGDLLVGGTFDSIGGDIGAGGILANNIARYNPSTGVWTDCGGGVSGEPWRPSTVNTIVVLPDGDAIVGGWFSSAGGPQGVSASRIARYSPSTNLWSSLGSGISAGDVGAVNCLALLPDGFLLVGGRFDTAGGTPATSLARYDLSSGNWSALGSGLDPASYVAVGSAAILENGDIVVAGHFSSAGGVPVKDLARFVPRQNGGGTWSAIGTDVISNVGGIVALPDGDLLIDGRFTPTVGGTDLWLARYHPTTETGGTLSLVSPSMNGSGSALALLPDGDVLMGGVTAPLDRAPASGIARYNVATGQWFIAAEATDARARAFAVLPDGDVVAGGFRLLELSGSTAYLARFSLGDDAIVIVQQPGSVGTCPFGTATLSVVASGPGRLTYRWLNNYTPISSASNPSAATPTLILPQVQPLSVGPYRCVVSDACGRVVSDAAFIAVCSADLTCDGGVDIDDLFAFLVAFENGSTSADLDDGGFSGVHDGAVTTEDLLFFLVRFEAGC